MPTKVSGGSRFQAMRRASRAPFELPGRRAAWNASRDGGACQSSGGAMPLACFGDEVADIRFPREAYLGQRSMIEDYSKFVPKARAGQVGGFLTREPTEAKNLSGIPDKSLRDASQPGIEATDRDEARAHPRAAMGAADCRGSPGVPQPL